MDTDELDAAIGELELRVERLRSLYEQYFLGIEKIEPGVARKDVDRRIWQLKREKIRNTARRFKLQTVIQRYNTYQQYWQRICREIENGTYRRHVLRAERATTTVSDAVAKQAQERATQGQAESEVTQAVSHEVADMLARDVDAEQEFARAVAAATRPLKTRGRAVPRQRMDTLDLELDGLEDPNERSAKAQDGSEQQAVPRSAASRPRNLLAGLGRRQAVPAKPAQPSSSEDRLARRSRPQAHQSAAKPTSASTSGGSSGHRANDAATARQPAKGGPAGRAAADAGLSEQRIAELHRQLLAAKQRTKEAGKVSVKGLTKSLRAAESKLKQQYTDRRIDFDVVIKNGKAVVKPRVR